MFAILYIYIFKTKVDFDKMSHASIEESNKNSDNDDEFTDDDFILEEGDSEYDSKSSNSESDSCYDSGDKKVIDSLKRKKGNNDDFSCKNYNGVKTRSQRNRNEKVFISTPKSSQIDVNVIWNSMNDKKPSNEADYRPYNSSEEKVKISRIYEFAGKVETEEKFVPKDSLEAKVHFSSLNDSKITQFPLRKPTKRLSSLEISNNKPVKLNTLEKSRLDWAKFVDKEGISEELKNASKDGYMDKQLFLQVAEERMIKNIKESMKK
ncbi:hypothetical protein PNEG_00628 [Pneumocystis murina B123]|uniref:SWR1-complex protein 5 n=1 Tax=Pneumocystis murina (strain B123) TaxID=1069680 RepID=M7PAX7_PNEMU|nr:hypothetical protein PNEG_00628 [Pneumocystis murina B123]EMR11030.1 hypothetical protein PNEG_00628 [Pneumocystis murina B123]